MVVLAEVVVVELDQALDGLLHCAHLDQRHLVVFPGNATWSLEHSSILAHRH